VRGDVTGIRDIGAENARELKGKEVGREGKGRVKWAEREFRRFHAETQSRRGSESIGMKKLCIPGWGNSVTLSRETAGGRKLGSFHSGGAG
jgi:hypothetical protein